MITIIEEIAINADRQKVWRFLSDFEISLNANSFHKQIIIPNKFSLTAKNPEFNIIYNFGLGNIDMNVEVVDYKPLQYIKLLKKNNHNSYVGFKHSSQYELVKDNESTKLIYSTIGSFNFKVQNIPFRPILIKAIKTELITMKNMIESSCEIPNQIKTKITAT